MRYELRYFETQQLLVVRTWERSSLHGFKQMLDAIRSHPMRANTRRILIDHRLLEVVESSKNTREFAEALKRNVDDLLPARRATVVSSALLFGLTRMWETLIEVADVTFDHVVTEEVSKALGHLGLNATFEAQLAALPPPGSELISSVDDEDDEFTEEPSNH
ncbi:MAG: hypothetical protein CSB49_00510 [Proteobacteria bacterium]|nr:MAG: hypothetical protein CSB49_00510 [Pseudomonadota bacterium]